MSKLHIIWRRIILTVLVSCGVSWSQTAVRQSVFGSGGLPMSNDGYRIMGTLGQTIAGVTMDDTHSNQGGFWFQAMEIITDVESTPDALPEEFRLEQNYPNPFNPITNFKFSIPVQSRVTLTVFDMLGREVARLVDDVLSPGEYTVEFDARGFPSGIYLYQIRAGGYLNMRKFTLLK